MIPLKDNVDLECYLVTKHSWKGKYKRILSVGSAGISTYNPEKFEVTNRWSYPDIISIAPSKNSSVSESIPKTIEATRMFSDSQRIYSNFTEGQES